MGAGRRRRARRRPALTTEGIDWVRLEGGWTALVQALVQLGYLDRRAGDRCMNRQGPDGQDEAISRLIHQHCGFPGQWPLRLDEGGQATDEDMFFTLVEVVHDLVSRPRVRQWHDYDEDFCWSSEFSDSAGQAVYRWSVNELFERHSVEYRLASEGEDAGILVRTLDDPRQDLQVRVRDNVSDGNENRVDHAIALIRKREATVEDKRSACAALSNVLEDRRRTVLEDQLVKDDEGPLFHIANKFAIRHHRDDQMYGYDEAFLDWIFWWYLATVELSNRLIAREVEQATEAP